MGQRAQLPKPPIPRGWSGFLQPFDLIWKLDKGTDANGLPVNPQWSAQLSKSPVRPNFAATCGGAFDSAGSDPNTAWLAKNCTSQPIAWDLRKKDISADPPTRFLCPARPLRGHLNYGVATYTGKIRLDGWSTKFWLFDNEVTFTLTTPGDPGLTNLRNGLHGEFGASDTVDQFESDRWKKLTHAFKTITPSIEPGRVAIVDGRTAVVTGLIGVDGVHGGHTESHPVYILALQAEQNRTNQSVEETWAFFLRNSGAEGDCSKAGQVHTWEITGNSYYIQFPWPEGALDVSVSGKPDLRSYLGDVTGAALEQSRECRLQEGSPGCTLLRVDARNPQDTVGVYGEIKLVYRMGVSAKADTPPSPPPPGSKVETDSPQVEKVSKDLRSRGATEEEIRKNLPPEIARFESNKQEMLQARQSQQSQQVPAPPPRAAHQPITLDITTIRTHEMAKQAALGRDRVVFSKPKQDEDDLLKAVYKKTKGK